MSDFIVYLFVMFMFLCVSFPLAFFWRISLAIRFFCFTLSFFGRTFFAARTILVFTNCHTCTVCYYWIWAFICFLFPEFFILVLHFYCILLYSRPYSTLLNCGVAATDTILLQPVLSWTLYLSSFRWLSCLGWHSLLRSTLHLLPCRRYHLRSLSSDVVLVSRDASFFAECPETRFRWLCVADQSVRSKFNIFFRGPSYLLPRPLRSVMVYA